MSRKQPRWLTELDKPYAVPAGTEIITQDTVLKDVFLIADGIVQLLHQRDREAPIVAGLRFPGWFVGVESAIVGRRAPLAAHALTACEIHRVSCPTFVQWLNTDPDLSWRIAQMHGREIFDQAQRSTEHAVSPIERLKALLIQLIAANEATALHKKIRMRLPLDDSQIAQLLSVSERQVRALMAQLQREEYVRRSDDVITVLNPRGLRQAHVRDVGWPVNRWTADDEERPRRAPRRNGIKLVR